MPLTWDQIQTRAFAFAKKWQDASNEEADAQGFITALLAVFGVEDPRAAGAFERKVALDEGHKGYFDYLWPGRIAIEMKSAGKDLAAAYKQLANYVLHLDGDEMPALLLVSDFRRVELHHRTSGQCVRFHTANLPKYVRHFAILAGYEASRLQAEQISVNVRAAEKTARLHDALKAGGYAGHRLEVYLVRLLFCFFAEDTGLFPKGSFQSLVENAHKDGSDLAGRLSRLFEVLNTPDEELARQTKLPEWFRQFRYVNGGLFAENLPSADFDAAMRKTLLDCCDFDWSGISPAIFGAMFQGVLDAETRRELGAHYTSEENILKVIEPLFLDELWREFERARVDARTLAAFHDKIGRLHFLDPACGCGNFLIVAYRELRKLELEILKERFSGQQVLDIRSRLKVSVAQFSGMDIEEFPCQIAQVGMWLMDHLMNLRAAEEFGEYFARLPLEAGANIRCCNALEVDWNEVVPKEKLSYIMGNPPFVGASMMTAQQKQEAVAVFGKGRRVNSIDYVGAWYHKAAALMQGTTIRAAFVSTNSITQGEQVAALWDKLLHEYKTHIDFCRRTFRWDNEASGKAKVHCVIIGFSVADNAGPRWIYTADGRQEAKNINPYLVDAPDILVSSRAAPLCEAPRMTYGNKPSDGGNLILSQEERDALVAQDPNIAPYVRRYVGSRDFINNDETRYCLWLKEASPALYRKNAEVMRRLQAVRDMRAASSAAPTRAFADRPYLFFSAPQTESNFLCVPEVSSERRRYIPIGFLGKESIASNKLLIVPDATLYHFGILISSAHMAWTRTVCGRMKSDYQYSGAIVYNNFPWPDAPETHRAAIEKTARAILDARALYPDSSLADLYDELTMPPELRKAHQHNDRAVLFAYGLKPDTPEAEIVAALMGRYRALAEKG